MKKSTKRIAEKLIDPFFFIVGAFMYFILSPALDGELRFRHILLSVIIGSLFVGVIRIFLPYSRMSKKESRAIDKEFSSLTTNAFVGNKKCRRKLSRALRLYHNNQFARATVILDRIFPSAIEKSDRIAVCYLSGLCNFKLGLLEYAVDDFEACAEMGKNPEALICLGNCHLAMYNDKIAQECFIRALDINGTDTDALCGISEAEARLGDLEGSLRHAELALEQDPSHDSALALAVIACVMLKNGREKEFLPRLDLISPSLAEKIKAEIPE